MDRRQLATAAVLAAAILFGTTGTVLARGPDGASALGVGAVRLLIGGGALCAIAALRRERVDIVQRWIPSALAGGVAVACYQLLFFQATTRAGVALGTVTTIGSGPVFSGLIEMARTRSLPRRGWLIGTAAAVVGVILLGVVGRDTAPDAWGILCALGSGLGWATYATIGRWQIERGLPSTVSMAAMFTLAGLLCAPLLLVEPLDWLATPGGWTMVLYLGVVTVGVAYTLYGWGLRSLTAPTVITLTLAEPLTAALLAFVILDEAIGVWGSAGIALVAAGLVITARDATTRHGTVRRT
jgi:drug/metabolite transporter, DME family